jgi:hypothetical protein
MAAVIERLRAEGKTVNDEDIARLSPARYEHINLQPLRPPTEQSSR